MTRREAREAAFELIYERTMNPDTDAREVYDNSLYVRDAVDNDYINNVYFGVENKREMLDEKIAETSKDWSLERMSKVTVTIMRLAVYEFYFERTIPTSVTINEAVELAKKYDADTAPAFINGILNKISKDEKIEKDPFPRKSK